MHNTNTQTYVPRHTYSFSLDVSKLCKSSTNQTSSSTPAFPYSSFLLCGSLPYLLFLMLLLTFFLLVSSSEPSVELCFHRFVFMSQQDLTFLLIFTTYHTNTLICTQCTHACIWTNKQNKLERLLSTWKTSHQITHQNIGGDLSSQRWVRDYYIRDLFCMYVPSVISIIRDN